MNFEGAQLSPWHLQCLYKRVKHSRGQRSNWPPLSFSSLYRKHIQEAMDVFWGLAVLSSLTPAQCNYSRHQGKSLCLARAVAKLMGSRNGPRSHVFS